MVLRRAGSRWPHKRYPDVPDFRQIPFLTAVSDVDFDVAARSTYALVGESGSGKSTIGRMLVGLLTPSEGTVEINGVNLATETDAGKVDVIRSDIQMIFQDPFASLNPRWRVRDIIVEPVNTGPHQPTGRMCLSPAVPNCHRHLQNATPCHADTEQYPCGLPSGGIA